MLRNYTKLLSRSYLMLTALLVLWDDCYLVFHGSVSCARRVTTRIPVRESTGNIGSFIAVARQYSYIK